MMASVAPSESNLCPGPQLGSLPWDGRLFVGCTISPSVVADFLYASESFELPPTSQPLVTPVLIVVKYCLYLTFLVQITV